MPPTELTVNIEFRQLWPFINRRFPGGFVAWWRFDLVANRKRGTRLFFRCLRLGGRLWYRTNIKGLVVEVAQKGAGV